MVDKLTTKSVWILFIDTIDGGYSIVFDSSIPLGTVKANYYYPADVPIGRDPLTWEYDDAMECHIGSDSDYGEVARIYQHDVVMSINENDESEGE